MIWYPPKPVEQAADSVNTAFVKAYGYPAAGVWTAPGRVNLIGEHVDYNGGLCLPFALEHRAFAAIAARDDNLIRLTSDQFPDPTGTWQGSLEEIVPRQPQGDGGGVQGWPGYAAGVAWAMRAAGMPVRGFDLAVTSSVPLGAGLSSSASLECCVAVGLDRLFDVNLAETGSGRRQLAAACVRAENEIAGAPTGGMDQLASLLASAGHGLLLDCQDLGTEQIALDLARDGLRLLVIDTRAHHSLADGQYGSRRRLCERAAGILGVGSLRQVADDCEHDVDVLPAVLSRLTHGPDGADIAPAVRHVVTEVIRVRQVAALLRSGSSTGIGGLLDASHASLRDDYRVSCAELDLAVEAARDAGALGARMTGGGFGGSAIALAPIGAIEAIAARVTAAFGAAGFAEPAFLVAVPSGPAARVA